MRSTESATATGLAAKSPHSQPAIISARPPMFGKNSSLAHKTSRAQSTCEINSPPSFMHKNQSQSNVALGDRPPASTTSWPAAGPGASKPRRGVFNTPRKTGGVTLLKLPPRCRRSLGIKRSPQRTTANRNVPAAAEFCTKVTCFNYEKLLRYKNTKSPRLPRIAVLIRMAATAQRAAVARRSMPPLPPPDTPSTDSSLHFRLWNSHHFWVPLSCKKPVFQPLSKRYSSTVVRAYLG